MAPCLGLHYGTLASTLVVMTTTSQASASAADTSAQNGFSKSIVISGVRCLLTYVLLPFAAPFLHLSSSVGPWVGLVVGSVAIAANVFSIRRFWAADHRWKKHVTVLHVAVIALLLVLAVRDLQQLVT